MKNLSELINNIYNKAPTAYIVIWPDQLKEMVELTFDEKNQTKFGINDLNLKAQKFFADKLKSDVSGDYCVIAKDNADPDAFDKIVGFYPDQNLIVFEYPDPRKIAPITFIRIEG